MKPLQPSITPQTYGRTKSRSTFYRFYHRSQHNKYVFLHWIDPFCLSSWFSSCFLLQEYVHFRHFAKSCLLLVLNSQSLAFLFVCLPGVLSFIPTLILFYLHWIACFFYAFYMCSCTSAKTYALLHIAEYFISNELQYFCLEGQKCILELTMNM